MMNKLRRLFMKVFMNTSIEVELFSYSILLIMIVIIIAILNSNNINNNNNYYYLDNDYDSKRWYFITPSEISLKKLQYYS